MARRPPICAIGACRRALAIVIATRNAVIGRDRLAGRRRSKTARGFAILESTRSAIRSASAARRRPCPVADRGPIGSIATARRRPLPFRRVCRYRRAIGPPKWRTARARGRRVCHRSMPIPATSLPASSSGHRELRRACRNLCSREGSPRPG